MHWIIIGVIFILTQTSTRDNASPPGFISIAALASPVPKDPTRLNPYIRYWEAAHYDTEPIRHVRQYQQDVLHRRKRNANIDSKSSHMTTANKIKLNFFAHDKQFNVLLQEDPLSVFSSDVQIENTLGPIHYDISRVYSGTLEDDENAFVHGVLTSENLFDGTITTNLEQYYIEPSSKYSEHLNNAGIHSIVYKISDIQHPAANPNLMGGNSGAMPAEHCASEKLRKKLKTEYKKRRKRSGPKLEEYDNNLDKFRYKRWLPDELAENHNPLKPLDLDVPYNDDFNVLNNENTNKNDSPANSKIDLNHGRKNILFNDYNPSSDFNLRNKNKNIIVNSFDNDSSNNNYNNNMNNGNLSRPSHKTHVEIITKNGATKKPNIIVNNYNPDVILTSTNFHHTNIHSHVRNDINDNFQRSSYDRKITCMLYLQADHTFSQKMGSDEASIEAITRHVQRANVIYKNTDFNGDGKPDNITFMIKRIKVHNMNALKDPTYRFPGNYGVEKFLELFSEEDYDAFCLAYMFTYRDFEMGTLGLAWTGDLKNAGGVCEKNGHYRGSLKSLNTGIVTLLNYGKHVPPAVSHVTLAHEIGHNFGSPHDPEQCTPGGEDGNYIMFARATSGDKRNNNKFSPCSLKAIEPVLNAKARSAKGCFTEPQQAICGNGVVDPGEQCDCGWEEDCKDSCCYPMSRHPKSTEKPCTLTPRASCSPSQGPCCTTTCELKFGDKCRDDNGCRDPSFCDGRMPQCPPSINKANKTICNKEFVCYMGECTGSICLAYGLESCQCIPGPNDPITKACELCCKLPGEESPCKSSFEWNEIPYDVPDVFAKPGTPCNDYNGYCDVFQKCREVDPSGPLATLRKLLLSEESIATFKKWMQTNWYTVVLIVVAVIILLVLSTKLLGKGTSMKKKHVTIIHSATTETVRLPDDNNGVIVHTAVRSKVPFKKKAQGKRPDHKSQKTSKGTGTPGATSSTPADTTGGTQSTNVFKRPKTLDSPKANAKKKKRVSAPVVDEEQNKTPAEPAPIKMKKQKKSKSKHKEIIDYSSRSENHTNTFGKVQKWLLESPIVSHSLTTGSAAVEHESKVHKMMSKSQSTPERLAQRTPKKIKSVGNLNDKVRLQVVYKPPFKFSLKLSKNSAVKTKVIGGGAGGGRTKRKQRGEKLPATGTATVAAGPKSRRTALLIRSVETNNVSPIPSTSAGAATPVETKPEKIEEPTYETLNPKKDNVPVYENILPTSSGQTSLKSSESLNTATFKINRSTSGSNVMKNYSISKGQKLHRNNSQPGQNLQDRGSSSNLVGISKFEGSQQNLIRSSTTNLSKNRESFDMKRGAYDLSRSSTTNLTKDKLQHGSHANLMKHRRSNSNLNLVDDMPLSRSRKNSSTTVAKNSDLACVAPKANIPRVPSSSNLKVPSLRRGSISNIPRASLNANSFKNHSHSSMFSGLPSTSKSSVVNRAGAITASNSGGVGGSTSPTIGTTGSVDPSLPIRPHTADCGDIVKRFEWPKNLVHRKISNEEPLPSDLEVMVSDVEGLVNDV